MHGMCKAKHLFFSEEYWVEIHKYVPLVITEPLFLRNQYYYSKYLIISFISSFHVLNSVKNVLFTLRISIYTVITFFRNSIC